MYAQQYHEDYRMHSNLPPVRATDAYAPRQPQEPQPRSVPRSYNYMNSSYIGAYQDPDSPSSHSQLASVPLTQPGLLRTNQAPPRPSRNADLQINSDVRHSPPEDSYSPSTLASAVSSTGHGNFYEHRPDYSSPSPATPLSEPHITAFPELVKKESRPDATRTRKARREKPRLALAPDQPPTTQGKPRARVYVACLQCRTRKIRCDGAKPACHNCSHRASGDSACNYDAVPKRRGPDKTPGARQRMARDVRNEIGEDEAAMARKRRRRRAAQSPTEVSSATHSPEFEQRPESSGQNRSTPRTLYSPHSHASASHSPTDSGDSPLTPQLTSPMESPYMNNDGFGPGTSPSRGQLPFALYPTHKPPVQQVPMPFDISYDTLDGRASLQQHAYITSADDSDSDYQSQQITPAPSLNFTRKIWWDSLLSLYSSPSSTQQLAMTSVQRENIQTKITADIRFLFKCSNYWFSFFHVPTFFAKYFDPSQRERMQPSLVLAMLSLSTFWQSSEASTSLGRAGRERALRFRDEAQSALEASFNAGWIDETLAHAAWLLALFEICAHPKHSWHRSMSSISMLDAIIRGLSLTLIDAGDPETSVFTRGTVPAVPDHERPASPLWPSSEDSAPGCNCASLTLGQHWPATQDHCPMWHATPAWNNSWSEAEIRKESCRRLCWSSITLSAGHTTYASDNNRRGPGNLFMTDPANYALLFSGESLHRGPDTISSKDSIWALHDRCFLLWHGCIRMRNDPTTTVDEKAQFAMKAWLEADHIEAALNKHTCDIERNFIFQGREYIFNTRMCVSYEFSRFIPMVPGGTGGGTFQRYKAEEWLNHQAVVAQRFMQGLHIITGNANNLLARRPFFVFWFMGQVSRALGLWDCDPSMTIALDVSKAFLPAIDYLTALWPCPEQRERYDILRARLDQACFSAGLPPLPPRNTPIL